MSSVKKGFLNKKKATTTGSARVTALAEAGLGSGNFVEDDSRSHFAFLFPMHSYPWEIYDLTCQYVKDYLSDFTLEVIGTTVADGYTVVGVEFYTSQTQAVDNAVFVKRDLFMFKGSYLSAATIENPSVFVKPVDPAHASGGASSSVSGLPGGVPVLPGPAAPRAASAPPSAPVRSPHRPLVQKVFTEVPLPPGLPALPSDPHGAQDGPWTQVLASLGELTTFVKSEMVTRRHLEAYHEEHLTLLTARIDQAVAPINEEIQGLRSRLAVLEGGSARNRGFSERPRSTDPAFKRIVFKKIPENMSAHQRILAMEEFMRTHFPNIRIRDVANFYKGKFPDGRSLTRAAYIEFSNSDVRREVMDAIGGAKGQPPKIKCNFGGSQVDVKPAMTENAIQRNASLRRAADLLKDDPRSSGKLVKIEFGGDRGVTVDKAFAFTQSKDQLTGQFTGVFSDLRLP